MKYCINDACKAELDDYQVRCPNCGRLQRKPGFAKPIQDEPIEQKIIVERNGFITFWLWLVLVGNIISSIIDFFPKTMWGRNYPDDLVVYSVILGCFGVINIIGVVLLLSWKKIGFTIFAVSTTIGSILSSLVMSTIPFGVVGIVVLWFILTIKKNGISYWEAMD